MYKRVLKIVKTDDNDFKEILKHSSWAFVLLGLAAVLQFVFDLLLARSFGAEGAGLFYLTFSVIISASLIGRLGLNKAVVRYIPGFVAKKDWQGIHGVRRAAFQLTLLLSTSISIIIFLSSSFIAEALLDKGEITNYLRLFSLAIPFFSLIYVQAGFLRGLKQIKESMIVERIGPYAVAILAVSVFGYILELDGVFIGFILALSATTIFGEFLIKKSTPPASSPVKFSKKTLLLLAAPLLLVEFSNQMSGQLNIMILGAFGSTEAVGIFNIAVKVSLLIGVLLTGINSITTTKISELYNKGDAAKLEIIVSKTAGLALLCGIPFMFILFVFPQFVLGLFGNDFVEGSRVLQILVVGQLINLSVGSVTQILAMTGHERSLAITIISSSLVLNAALSFLLIPPYGITGAAIAVSSSIVIKNIIQLFLVKKYLGVWSLPFKAIHTWLHS